MVGIGVLGWDSGIDLPGTMAALGGVTGLGGGNREPQRRWLDHIFFFFL